MAKVVLIRCETYEQVKVEEAITRGLKLIGGADKFAKKGERILLKPNLLVGDPPEKCVTTHPAVFKAVGSIFKKTGATIVFGDSPAINTPLSAARRSKILQAAEELHIELVDFEKGKEIFFEEGVQNRKFLIANGVLESDALISLPKLKTHGLEKLTGSVKNQFGCIPGFVKGEYHVKLPDANDFARMLVDLNNYLKPRLYIMDGIYGMEGNGPRGGTPRQMNLLLMSEDPIALDATLCRLLDVEPEFVPTVKFGYQTGAGTYLTDEIELLGDEFQQFKNCDFNIDREQIRPFIGQGILRFLNNRLVSKPYIVKEKCIKCGQCVTMCPTNPKSVNWQLGNKKKVPRYDYGSCIRCYCCQELCPEKAIKLKVPFSRRVLTQVRNLSEPIIRRFRK
ncbi:DUF362 domain-containing protein [Candidatus Riflebacteria bacterium]